MKLDETKCDVCRVGGQTATDEEITRLSVQVPEWNVSKDNGTSKLVREFSFKNFREALEFTNAVGDLAENEGHHPEITTAWGKVVVTWWTHKVGGLHQNDFAMAAKTDLLINKVDQS